MQTVITVLVVSGAVAYVAWQWMPAAWRTMLRGGSVPRLPAGPDGGGRGTCSTCATCPGCTKG